MRRYSRHLLVGFALAGACVAACGKSSDSGDASLPPDDGSGGDGDAALIDVALNDAAKEASTIADAADASDASDAAALTCHPSGPLDCSPSTVGSNYQCVQLPSNFQKAVNTAIQSVMAQNPTWFDTTKGAPCCPLCIQPASFVAAVVAAIKAGGLCAEVDPNNPSIQIVVKHDAACSEGFLVLTSANYVHNPGKYSESCVPAWL